MGRGLVLRRSSLHMRVVSLPHWDFDTIEDHALCVSLGVKSVIYHSQTLFEYFPFLISGVL